MTVDFRARPLTAADSNLYIERPIDAELRVVLRGGHNVVLGVRRGAGATSLLFSVAAKAPESVYVNGEYAESGEELLRSLLARLDAPQQLLPDLASLTHRPDPLGAPPEIRQLRKLLGRRETDSGNRMLFLIDGPLNPGVARALFGRWRDELFSVPASWLVVAHEERLRQYVTPPADVFFDRILSLSGFSDADAASLLFARGAWDELSSGAREHVTETFDGTPRHLLRLARQELDGPPAASAQPDDSAATVGRGAGMLLAEMQGRSPVTATDQNLQRRLGITERQLRRTLNGLEMGNYVERVPGNDGKPGRPAATFQLSDRGRAWAGVA